MSGPYYSQRKALLASPPDPKLRPGFINAFTTYIDRLSEEQYLCQTFGWECGGCGRLSGKMDLKIQTRLQEELGEGEWPIPSEPENDHILDLLEFFFKHVSKPEGEKLHCYDGNSHFEKHNVGRSRREYTTHINAMLLRFNHPYKLVEGKLLRMGSEVLDARILNTEFRTNDSHLLRLLNSARDSFFDRSGTRKLDALWSIANALERIKTLESKDKKESVLALLNKLSPEEKIKLYFDNRLTRITELHNISNIRHSEIGKIELSDQDLMDHLFYDYWNLVRFILQKYDIAD